MFAFYELLFFLVAVQPSSSQKQTLFSSFLRTRVLENNCQTLNLISESRFTDETDCLFRCGQDTDCRRVLYCPITSQCNLYKDGTDCMRPAHYTPCSCYRKRIGYIDDGTTVTCPVGYYGNKCENIVKDCFEAGDRNAWGSFHNARTFVQPLNFPEPVEIECLFQGKGFVVLMDRTSLCKQEDFARPLKDYEEGFGVAFNMWLGFEKMLAIMDNYPTGKYVLHVLLKTAAVNCTSMYDGFKLGNKSTDYVMTVEGYRAPSSGLLSECGDSILGSIDLSGRPFSTYDSDHTGTNNCSVGLQGGWWFSDSPGCSRSFLTGWMNGTHSENFWYENVGRVTKRATLVLGKATS